MAQPRVDGKNKSPEENKNSNSSDNNIPYSGPNIVNAGSFTELFSIKDFQNMPKEDL